MKIHFSLLFVLIPLLSFSQSVNTTPLKHLVNKVWKANGNWGDGSPFKQEISFSLDLNESIIISKTKGSIDETKEKYGNRNHGVRMYDTSSSTYKFWEFDVFGGVTTGDITFIENDIYYTYQYGESIVTDLWEYVNQTKYNYKVGILVNDEWQKVFLETTFSTD
ncbi:MAG: hypothetical protein BM563_05995 [Bacteroidetes bacterium MedPE-SWsnd-G1]|nr:MAG: hypothetical protein BM563_05995 [Bacteroidetes bacterium MedPE-SWsnd-G1]